MNILQFTTFESTYSDNQPRNVLSVLPLSHALALIGLCHVCVYRGDGLVTLQGFDLRDTLAAIETHKVDILWMVSMKHHFEHISSSSYGMLG